ncbi:MAG: MmcQ/YjbR family DNA-binding protein [Planctomycetota bacterium]
MSKSPLDRVREICLALPSAHETLTWGHPHFRVKDKIFAGFNDAEDGPRLGFKLDKEDASFLVVSDPRIERAPYVGKHGWVTMDLSGRVAWTRVREYVRTSYRLIAPKRLVAELDGSSR